jgi:hypothetical protein
MKFSTHVPVLPNRITGAEQGSGAASRGSRHAAARDDGSEEMEREEVGSGRAEARGLWPLREGGHPFHRIYA